MATNLVFNAIVPEALTEDNYVNWSVWVKNYLLGQDLWDFIETESKPKENEATFNSWRKKNAMALHAMQISCGPEMMSQIREIESAKEAWDSLAKINNPQSQSIVDEPPISSLGDQSQRVDEPQISLLGDQSQRVDELISSGYPETTETDDEYARHQLVNVVDTGDWDATKDFLDHHLNEFLLGTQLSSGGITVLHYAVLNGHVQIVNGLVQLMSEEELKIQNIVNGNTALHYAVEYGFDELVTCMVEKDRNLLSIANYRGFLPTAMACCIGNEPLLRYLYSLTPLQDLTPENEISGADILFYFAASKMFDVAVDLLQKCPRLAFASASGGNNLMSLLSRMPSGFPSGNKLVLWQRWMYTCMHVPRPTPPSNDTPIDIPRQYQRQSNRGSIVTQVFGKLHRPLLSYLLKLSGIKQIYDTTLIHVQVLQLLAVIGEEIRTSKLEIEPEALIRAVEHGIVEFVMEITKAAPNNLFGIKDTKKRSIFQYAIASRQEKILSLVYGLHPAHHTVAITSTDQFGNHMLHYAGMLAPFTHLDRIPGAALQMQRELQWFKEVEHIVLPASQEMLNSKGQTARELFTKEHMELVKEGQKWMKDTATSCAFVGALIVTIMFTAAFTVPGGNNGTTGFPIFSDKKWFKVFILCDAISFLFATTSILIFLGILTSRYAEEDFLKSLPTKMILGLTSLFISIASMIIAFCATLSLMLNGQMLGIFVPILVLASVPIIVFVLLQFPLLVEIFISTFGPSIFDRKTKCWYKY